MPPLAMTRLCAFVLRLMIAAPVRLSELIVVAAPRAWAEFAWTLLALVQVAVPPVV